MGQGLSWRDGQEVGEAGEAREGRLQGWWCSGHGEVQEDKNQWRDGPTDSRVRAGPLQT